MGNAFMTRRGSGAKEQSINFDNTPMVATKTLSNALTTARVNMGVATDDEHIAFVCGEDFHGTSTNDVDIFTRSAQHYHATWPDKLVGMATIIQDGRLMCIGGFRNNAELVPYARRWSLGDMLDGNVSHVRMGDLFTAKRDMMIAKYKDGVLTLGGSDTYGATMSIDHYMPYSNYNDSNSNGHYNLGTNSKLSYGRTKSGCASFGSACVAVAGGIHSTQLLSAVEVVTITSIGAFDRYTCDDLSSAQHSPVTAEIYSEGFKCVLWGLGKKNINASNNALEPQIVDTLDIYYSDGTSQRSCSPTKYGTITLPLLGAPTSAIGLSFGDCALFIIGYAGGIVKNKGYLVKVYSPSVIRVSSMEFDFSRDNMQGGVIGKDVAYLAGGTKNGQATTDVEMIKLMRDVPIYPGMKYRLGYMDQEETANSCTLYPLEAATHLMGYMKL
jgi:hypothetical protein